MTQQSRPTREDPPVDSPAQVIRPGLILLAVAATAIVGVAFYMWQTTGMVASSPATRDGQPSQTIDHAVAPPTGNQTTRIEPPRVTATPPMVAQPPLRNPGNPLPRNLLSRLSNDQTMWYVGSLTTESLVEIPFPPGLQPLDPPDLPTMRENPGFLGAQSCQSCHAEKYETFIHTAHHLSSQFPTDESIAGSFEPGKNQMKTKNPNVSFKMIKRDSRFYQQVKFYDWEFEIPIDLVIGSSKLGQAYVYWDFNALYQMHVTYLTETDAWTNSPGYLDGDAGFARPVRARCLECHSTYADVGTSSNRYIPSSLILGVSCERCHGPGQSHVDYHAQHPGEKESRFMVVPSKLSREREMDVCGQCHTGGSTPKGLPYSFRPGDRLDDHYYPLEEDTHRNSVHASNQASRLAISKCFQGSEMGCVDCHNPHRNERGQLALFSSRCLKCHTSQQCGKAEQLGDRIADNCIDCHMPASATENMQLETDKGDIFPPLRDHHIRIDPKATEQYLKELAQ